MEDLVNAIENCLALLFRFSDFVIAAKAVIFFEYLIASVEDVF